MRRAVYVTTSILLLALGFGAWLMGAMQARQLSAAPRSYRIQYGGQQVLSDWSRGMLEEEALTYVLARQQSGVEARAEQFSRKQDLTLLETMGSPTLLLDSPLLSGGVPGNSGRWCVVSTETAQALWGSVDVLGKLVEIDNREYTVTGVADTGRALALVPARAAGWSFDQGVVVPSAGATFPRQELDNFLSRNGLDAAHRVTDQQRTARLLEQLTILPLWCLCLILGGWWLRQWIPHRGKWPVRLRRLLLLAMALAAARILGVAPSLWVDWLPSRWSEFSHWRTLWEDARAARDLGRSLPQTITAALLWGRYGRVLAWTAASFAGLLSGAAAWKGRSRAEPRERLSLPQPEQV